MLFNTLSNLMLLLQYIPHFPQLQSLHKHMDIFHSNAELTNLDRTSSFLSWLLLNPPPLLRALATCIYHRRRCPTKQRTKMGKRGERNKRDDDAIKLRRVKDGSAEGAAASVTRKTTILRWKVEAFRDRELEGRKRQRGDGTQIADLLRQKKEEGRTGRLSCSTGYSPPWQYLIYALCPSNWEITFSPSPIWLPVS